MTGQVPSGARAFVASPSESAKTGDAIVMPGWLSPAPGKLRAVWICSSTRSSSSELIERAQVNTSSATSIGYMYRQVPQTAGRG